MQNEITIVSFHETYTGDAGSHTINTFTERRNAKDFILNNLEDTDEYHKEILKKEVSKKLQGSLMLGKDDRISYVDGDHEYSITWDFVHSDGQVTDDETVRVLESFVNSNRCIANYRKVAEQITTCMHRYCQNELYKFIAVILRQMAVCNYDERNALMHNRAEKIVEFMDKYNL